MPGEAEILSNGPDFLFLWATALSCPSKDIKKRRCKSQRRFASGTAQKVTVRLGSVKEENVAEASVRAKTVVLPSPGV